MTTREVTGTIRRPDGTAWAGAAVRFKLDKSTYTADAAFPAAEVTVTTDGSGVFTAMLWCNAEGFVKTLYTATLPDGSSFRFRLSAGDGSPVDIVVLRAGGIAPVTPSDPLYVSTRALVAALEARLALYSVVLDADATFDPGVAARSLALIDTSVGDVTVTLPPLAGMGGRSVVLKKIAGGNVGVVDGDGSELIEGALVFNLEMEHEFIEVTPAGGQWRVIGRG
ncbi:MAG: hypothetical protein ABW250_22585 [Pyrinomonadaceae bacterium]